jgi:uncharacterized membrane protein
MPSSTATPTHDHRFFAPPNTLGLLLGALAFTGALTPSLIPRSAMLQGLLSGACFSCGYALGVLLATIWGLLLMPRLRGRNPGAWVALIALVIMIFGLWQATPWQSALHRAMHLPPIGNPRAAIILPVALLVILAFLFLGRLFARAVALISRQLHRVLPRRLALLLGLVLAAAIFNFIGSDLLLSHALQSYDKAYRAIDARIPTEFSPPSDPLKTGSTASLVSWQGLGAQGRTRISYPLDAAEIARISEKPAIEPLRVYVGLGNGETPAERANLALNEAIRIGAFQRKTMVIATPTGTGWVDPAAMLPLEVLTGGDVASISVQYSYLPSWMALFADLAYGEETARAVFAAIHGYWQNLPQTARPKLYLFGTSLGALNSDLSADFYDLVGAPHQGALWVGPPFASRSWAEITASRNPDSPQWLPRFRDGSVVRFMNQSDMPDTARDWGEMRIIYLQYASDPIVFFSPSTLWREPDWMRGPRGPDVSDKLRWMPVVTFLQLAFDVIASFNTAPGHGHVYAGRDYLRGWLALLSPEGWDEPGLARLNATLESQGL